MQRLLLTLLALAPSVAAAQTTGWSTTFDDSIAQTPTVALSNLDVLGDTSWAFTRLNLGAPLGANHSAAHGWSAQVDARLTATVVSSESRMSLSGGPLGVSLGRWRALKHGEGYWSIRARAQVVAPHTILAGPYALYLNETLPDAAAVYERRQRYDKGELSVQASVGVTGVRGSVWGARALGPSTAVGAGLAIGLLDPVHVSVGLRQRLGQHLDLSVDGLMSTTNPMVLDMNGVSAQFAFGPAIGVRWRGAAKTSEPLTPVI